MGAEIGEGEKARPMRIKWDRYKNSTAPAADEGVDAVAAGVEALSVAAAE